MKHTNYINDDKFYNLMNFKNMEGKGLKSKANLNLHTINVNLNHMNKYPYE